MRTITSLRNTITDKDTLHDLPLVSGVDTTAFSSATITSIFQSSYVIPSGFYAVSYSIDLQYSTGVANTNVHNKLSYLYSNEGINYTYNLFLTNSYITTATNRFRFGGQMCIFIEKDATNFSIQLQATENAGSTVAALPTVRIVDSYFRLRRIF